MGEDRFDNIMARLDQKIADPKPQSSGEPAEVTASNQLAEGNTAAEKVSHGEDGDGDGAISTPAEVIGSPSALPTVENQPSPAEAEDKSPMPDDGMSAAPEEENQTLVTEATDTPSASLWEESQLVATEIENKPQTELTREGQLPVAAISESVNVGDLSLAKEVAIENPLAPSTIKSVAAAKPPTIAPKPVVKPTTPLDKEVEASTHIETPSNEVVKLTAPASKPLSKAFSSPASTESALNLPTPQAKPETAPKSSVALHATPKSAVSVADKPGIFPAKPKLKPWAPGTAKFQTEDQSSCGASKKDPPPPVAPKPTTPTANKPSPFFQTAKKNDDPAKTTAPKPNSLSLTAKKFDDHAKLTAPKPNLLSQTAKKFDDPAKTTASKPVPLSKTTKKFDDPAQTTAPKSALSSQAAKKLDDSAMTTAPKPALNDPLKLPSTSPSKPSVASPYKPPPSSAFAMMASKFGGSVAKNTPSPTSPSAPMVSGPIFKTAVAADDSKPASTLSNTKSGVVQTMKPSVAPMGSKSSVPVVRSKPTGPEAVGKSPTPSTSSASKSATNRDEMLSRFGVRLAPKK